MPLNKNPLVITTFKGKLLTDFDQTIGQIGDTRQNEIPFDYSLESFNLEYLKKGGMRTRNGIDRYIQMLSITGKPVQAWKIEILNGIAQTDRWLILTWDATNGRMYDTGVTAPATNPVMTLAGMKYAFVLNAFGRMYISPWEAWAQPLGDAAGSSGGGNNAVWLYNGRYNARLTGGIEPVAGTFAAAATAGGACTPGLHLVSCAFETDSAYRTRFVWTHMPGVGSPLSVTTTAANATISLTNIPTGATGVVKRHIVVTKVVVNNNGLGFASYEPFFAITINDNTTTSINFAGPDSQLVDSAADLLDDTVGYCRSYVSMAVYGERMVWLGSRNSGTAPYQFQLHNTVAISPVNNPEQIGLAAFTTDKSVRFVGEDFSGKVMIGQELNGTFYVFKEDSTFQIIADNELDPIEWVSPVLVDGGKGAFPFGIAKIGNNPGSTNDDAILIAGNHGITYFNGRFSQRSIAEGILEEYAPEDLRWMKLLVDPIRQILVARIGDPYISTLTLHGDNNFILYANYYYGVDITTIRWGKFKYTTYPTVNSILVTDLDLRQPGTAGGVGPPGAFNTLYSLITILHSKFVSGTTYDCYILSEASSAYEFDSLIDRYFPIWGYDTGYTPNDSGEIYTFGPLKVRINSLSGSVSMYISKLDTSDWRLLGTFTPGQFPSKYISVNANEVGEHIKLRITGTNRSFIQKLILYMARTSEDRPRI